MSAMFSKCSSLSNVLLPNNFITKNVMDCSYMFYNCFSLKFIDISNFFFRQDINYKAMFLGCKKDLIKIIKNQKKIEETAFEK